MRSSSIPRSAPTLVAAASRRRRLGGRRPRPTPACGAVVPLVASVGPVIGRDDEVDALAAVLRRSLRRVVTLTGPGGVGRPRSRSRSPSGARGVPGRGDHGGVGRRRRRREVLPALAAAFGAFVADQRVTPEMLAPALAGRRTLLLLDNLERVLDVAPALTQLVTLCPDLVVLATSRAPLRIRVRARGAGRPALPPPPSGCSTITPPRPGWSSRTTRRRPQRCRPSVAVPTGCRWLSSWPPRPPP